MQDAVSQALGLCFGEFAGERQALCPQDEVVGDSRKCEPNAVVLEITERQAASSGVLVVADVMVDACAAAVLAFEVGISPR
jgi:hypothetical protein